MDSGGSSSDDDTTCFKVVVIGNSGVGKTTLIRTFCRSFTGFTDATIDGAHANSNGCVTGPYTPTLGVDFYSKKIQIPRGYAERRSTSAAQASASSRSAGELAAGETVMLHLWDVGGKQKGSTMLENYLHDCDAVLLVYDVTNAESFHALSGWYDSVRRALGETDPRVLAKAEGLDGRSDSGAQLPRNASDVGCVSPGLTVSPSSAKGNGTPTDGETSAGLRTPQSSAFLAISGVSPVSSPTVLTPALSRIARRRAGATPVRRCRPIVLIGAKTDSVPAAQQVSRAAHDALADGGGYSDSYLVSARTGEKVKTAFLKTVADLAGLSVRVKDLEGLDAVQTTLQSTKAERASGTKQLRVIGPGDDGKPVRGPVDDCVIM